jgi:hypothetical protein
MKERSDARRPLIHTHTDSCTHLDTRERERVGDAIVVVGAAEQTH